MAESLLLALFCLLPAGGVVGLWLFFKVFRLHESKKQPVLALVAGNALVLLTFFFVVLLLGECYYRWIYDASDSYGQMKTHQRWTSRHIQLNADGWRDTVPKYELKKSGKKRLVLVGDSFTAGQGINDVEDTLGFLLRKKMPEWEVRIHAISGWETLHELYELALMAQSGYETDAVLLVYCLNDITPVVPELRSAIQAVFSPENQPGFLVRNSYLLNVLYYRIGGAFHPTLGQYFDKLDDAYRDVPWQQQSQTLAKMESIVTNDLHAKFLVCTFPLLHSLGNEYRLSEVHDRLNRFWAESGTPHLDLLPVYEGYSPSQLVVNHHDAHPNEQAIVIAADAIADFLNKNLDGR